MIKKILSILLIGLFLTGCGDDDDDDKNKLDLDYHSDLIIDCRYNHVLSSCLKAAKNYNFVRSEDMKVHGKVLFPGENYELELEMLKEACLLGDNGSCALARMKRNFKKLMNFGR